jgi:hypothetical protein
MRFADFYHASTGWNGRDHSGPVTLIPACGSDAVLVIDGRWGEARAVAYAREVCLKRGWRGFTMNAGESFTRSRVTRRLEVVRPL